MSTEWLDSRGFAAKDDLATEKWRSLFEMLEAIQSDFLGTRPHDANYKWPTDALHTWSRLWEYPYAYYHIGRSVRTADERPEPVVLDFGSGITFFPFAVSRLGCRVICVDHDPKCEAGIARAANALSLSAQQVQFLLSDGKTLPLADCSIDAIYSISVLEHIRDPAPLIAELARVLKRGCHLVLTLDIDTMPGSEVGLGPERYDRVMSGLAEYFVPAVPLRHTHPARALTPLRSHYPMHQTLGRSVCNVVKQRVLKPLLGRRPLDGKSLWCEGLVVTRTDTPMRRTGES